MWNCCTFLSYKETAHIIYLFVRANLRDTFMVNNAQFPAVERILKKFGLSILRKNILKTVSNLSLEISSSCYTVIYINKLSLQ